ncbi:MAG: hypothetical protein ACI9XU_000658 [Arenicella sp.]|jgi:hypothetical protein
MKKSLRMSALINAVLFQMLWFACVLGSSQALLWPAVLMMGVMIVWQLHPGRRHPNDMKVLLGAVVLGLIIDTIWVSFGFMVFKDPRPVPWLSPAWIIIMWAGFALTINHSMSWLSQHPMLPALMGLIGGPLAYFAGQRLGAVEYLTDPVLISCMLAIAWAIALSLLVMLGKAKPKNKVVQ